MQLLRTINVLTMASLLILTGCFGLGDDTITPADGEDSHPHSDNNEPSSTFFLNTNQQMTENLIFNQTTGNATVTSITLSVYSAAVDPDGDNITCGWDIDLDGNVDYPTICTGEFTNLTIPIADWIEIPDSSESIRSIAFIVSDEPGAAIAEILDLQVPYTDGNLALYAFGGEDATGSVTDGTDDDLVRITMTQGRDLNWASISVKISVDNGAPVTCSNGDASGNCDLIEFGNTGDQFWSVGDGVTIIESGQDLCTSGSCVIKVTITDTREGKTLDESTAIAE
ncbi:MAG: hypothetical protein ACKVHN_05115 [Candidatus Poseidoniales archaeon]